MLFRSLPSASDLPSDVPDETASTFRWTRSSAFPMCASTPVSAHPLGRRVLPAWYAFLVVDAFVAGWGFCAGPGLASFRAHAPCPHFFLLAFLPWRSPRVGGPSPAQRAGHACKLGSLRQWGLYAKPRAGLASSCGTSSLVPCRPRLARLVSTCASSSGSLRRGAGPAPSMTPPHSQIEQLATPPIHPTPQRAAQHSEQIEEIGRASCRERV